MNLTPSPSVLRLGRVGEGVERRLRGDIAAEPRRPGLHPGRGDVDHLPAALPQAGQQADDQPHGAEVVELHDPLEVVQAVPGIRERAADRAAGAVDQHVHAAVVGDHPLDQRVDRLGAAEVGRVDCGAAFRGLDLSPQQVELLGAPGDQQHLSPGLGDPPRRGLADPRGGAGDQHDLAGDRFLEAGVGAGDAVEQAARIERWGDPSERVVGEPHGGRGRPPREASDPIAERAHAAILTQPARRTPEGRARRRLSGLRRCRSVTNLR